MSVLDPIPRIKPLSDDLINRIAAGEVIERPASVVKELLENSLDAGADILTITLKAGGSRMIQVTDNGRGIHPEDMALALERHSTNKLHSLDDLAAITTLGFRGEALASIAAISRFRITSCQSEAGHGTSLCFEDSRMSEVKPAPHPVGTTVEVRDLFYNTPARRKFLRSERTEYLHILELIKRIAISRPHLGIRLLHNDRRVLSVSRRDPQQRVQELLGQRFLQQAVELDEQAGELSLSGWMGLPSVSRSQNDQQYLYLNGRIIRDRMIQQAIRSACEGLLYPGRYPVYILYLGMNPGSVDVNVHPAKYEVRFRETRQVYDFIHTAIKRAVGAKDQAQSQYPTGTRGGQYGGYSLSEPVVDLYTTLEPKRVPDSDRLTIKGRYIFLSRDSGVDIIDIHKAREQILLQQLRSDFAGDGIVARPVLVPVAVRLNSKEMAIWQAHEALMSSLGFVAEQSSPDTFMIKSLPNRLVNADLLALFQELLACLKQETEAVSLTDQLLNICKRHANDGQTDSIAEDDATRLLSELEALRAARPVSEFQGICRHFTLKELEDLFRQ